LFKKRPYIILVVLIVLLQIAVFFILKEKEVSEEFIYETAFGGLQFVVYGIVLIETDLLKNKKVSKF
jgi:hypothetical protein